MIFNGGRENASFHHRLKCSFMETTPYTGFRAEGNKKALPPVWDKTLILRYHPICAEAPACSAYCHTRRPDNGCGTRRGILGRLRICNLTVRPALASPFAGPSAAVIPPPTTLLRQPLPGTSLAHRFVGMDYTRGERKCQVFFFGDKTGLAFFPAVVV